MESGDTPKKPVKRGRPISKAANDCCRLCSCKLKLQFGDFPKASYISTENLFKPSKREECRLDETLAELSSQIGLQISNSPDLSDRVCKSCGRKIRTAFQLYTFIKKALSQNLPSDTLSLVDQASEDSDRFKRLLPSSILSPDRSPRPKKGPKRSSYSSVAKKLLSFVDSSENGLLNEEEVASPQVNNPLAEINLNVDDLLTKQTTQVKVVIVGIQSRSSPFSSRLRRPYTKTLPRPRIPPATQAKISFVTKWL